MNHQCRTAILWLAAAIVLFATAMVCLGQNPVIIGHKTNWYFFTATAISSDGLESEYSNEVSTNRHLRNLWHRVTLAWTPSPSDNVIDYRIHWGCQSGSYTGVAGVFTGTTATVQVIPPPLSNIVLRVTTTNATNLMAAPFINGPWLAINRTSLQVTNPHTPQQFWRAMGKKNPVPRVSITNWLQ